MLNHKISTTTSNKNILNLKKSTSNTSNISNKENNNNSIKNSNNTNLYNNQKKFFIKCNEIDLIDLKPKHKKNISNSNKDLININSLASSKVITKSISPCTDIKSSSKNIVKLDLKLNNNKSKNMSPLSVKSSNKSPRNHLNLKTADHSIRSNGNI